MLGRAHSRGLKQILERTFHPVSFAVIMFYTFKPLPELKKREESASLIRNTISPKLLSSVSPTGTSRPISSP